MSSQGLSRRAFLSQAAAAGLVAGQPKVLAVTAKAAAASPFAKYALKKVASSFIPYFGWGAYFGNDKLPIDIDIINRADEIPLLDDIIELPAILNSDFDVPEYIKEGEIFRLGHLIADDNMNIMVSATKIQGMPDEWALGQAQASLNNFKEELITYIQSNPELGSLENLAETPVCDFYNHVCKPHFQKHLDKIMDGMENITSENFDFYGGYLNEIPRDDFSRLKKAYPKCANKLDEIMENYTSKKLNEKWTKHYPIGFTRIEKQTFGQFKLTSPQIL